MRRSLLLIGFSLMGCADVEGPVEQHSPPTRALAPTTLADVKNMDAVHSRITEAIPGFGGLFVQDGKLVVNLVNADKRADVEDKLRGLLKTSSSRPMRHVADLSIEFRSVPFDFDALNRWRESLRRLWKFESLASMDVNEAVGMIEIGVHSDREIAEIVKAALLAGVPRNAFRVKRVDGLRQISCTPPTLNDKCRPIIAGFRFRSSYNKSCTLGPTVWIGSNRVSQFALTAGHCFPPVAFRGGGPWYQPHPAGVPTPGTAIDANYMGAESIDPFLPAGAYSIPWRFGSPSRFCPEDGKCRWSDAVLVNITHAQFEQGRIARPIDFNSTVVGVLYPPSKVVHAEWYLPQGYRGDYINKVGYSTGWSRGWQAETCVDVRQVGIDIIFWCQDYVEPADPVGLFADNGDSGAPVFLHNPDAQPPGKGEVALIGVTIGMQLVPLRFAYSALANVGMDFAIDLRYCLDGYGC